MLLQELPSFVSLMAILVIGLFIRHVANKESGVAETTTAVESSGGLDRPRFNLPLTMTPDAGMSAWWLRRFHQRPAYEAEYLYDREEDGSIVVTLPLPRRVTRLELQFDSPRPVPLEDVRIETAADAGGPQWTGDWHSRSGGHCLQLDFDGTTPLDSVRVAPAEDARLVDCRLWLNRKGNPDAEHLEAAFRAQRQGRLDELVKHLLAYQELCPDNPVPALRLAFLHRLMDEPDKAEIQALRGIAANRVEYGVNFCRELAAAREWGLPDARLDRLRRDASAWELEGHHGLVTLNNERHYLAGPGNFLRERHVSAILVRRRAAARKFNSVGLPMVTGWGGLIYTAARVRRHDGSVDDIGDDKFTVGSAQDDNPYVAVARRSVGTWILPDLAPGDVVEFTCDKVRLGQERPFVLANLGDVDCPTLRGRVTFTAPPERDVVCAVLNTAPGFERGGDEATGWPRLTLDRHDLVPRRSHSDPYQRVGLNPVVGFAGRVEGWDAMGAALLGPYYEAAEAALEIPDRLKAAFAGEGTPREKLARAFYWIRDHIKYASVASHHDVLMSPERAAFVVESGMGDCKDVSYLLALVCRDLGIPWEFALASTEHGIILAELPADQFDHVILRAEIDGEWLYLDASGSSAIFSAPPALGQGMSVLCGRGPFALATVPVHSAERTRVEIRQTVAGVEDGWLHGSFEARLEGYPARLLDENWKHHSLTAVDPDRAADDSVGALLPGFCGTRIERRQDTSGGDVLDLEAEGRHARLVELDGRRIASFGFAAPGLFVDDNTRRRFREQFVFPYRITLEYELVVEEGLRDRVRAVSFVPDLEGPLCSIRETRGGPDEAVVLRREIVLRERRVAADDLDRLPELLNRLGAATRVVVALGK